ncbi:DNA methylase N-4/N-6 [Kosmotoga olearia]|uniref:DNA methylase N-4/N-6 n=1 Tax=Kosmotoga olearia (strain ATCC BAA-1733 / DSM 21960 / TBF 19.5.1) TaxID=521045 RepID=C5CHY5_KOSOT|nr:DNA methylase N-4/N-6 [Kosmotoga olearia]ACR78840.1 DNA methylase N-4/N-6 [Kosmotoga olearia TBF 19.5.1]
MKTGHIYKGDCIKVMREHIKDENIDLIYADPPYNLSGKSLNLINNKTGGPFYKMNEDWDTWDYNEYVEFTENWFVMLPEKLDKKSSNFV